MKLNVTFTTFAGLCLGLASTGFSDDAKSIFDSLFDAKIKAVSATGDRSDDVALAKEMLALAKTSANQPVMVTLLCDAAHDLAARHADGSATAAEAMTLLAETVVEKRSAARDKLILLLSRQSSIGKPEEREAASESLIALLATMGDEKLSERNYSEAVADYRRATTIAQQKKSESLDDMKSKLDFALSRDRTTKQLSRLEETLLKNANDAATAQEIVRLYVIELDDPAAAGPYLTRTKDEGLSRLIPLAAQEIDALNANDALQLGEWYRSQIKSLKSPEAAPAIERTRHYLRRFLTLHTTDDLLRTKATALLNEIEAAAKAAAFNPRLTELEIDIPATRVGSNPVEVADVRKGSTVKIIPISGSWTGGGTRTGKYADWTGYTGKGGWMALSIKLDDTETQFRKRDPIELKATRDGKLFLFCVDDKVSDNAGSIKVKVEIIAPKR